MCNLVRAVQKNEKQIKRRMLIVFVAVLNAHDIVIVVVSVAHYRPIKLHIFRFINHTEGRELAPKLQRSRSCRMTKLK